MGKNTFKADTFANWNFASGNWTGLGVAPAETGPLTEYLRRRGHDDDTLRHGSQGDSSLRRRSSDDECLRHLS